MSAFTKLQKIGLVVLIGSMLIAFGGTISNIYESFAGLAIAENAGIGPVGDSIRNALIFTVLGIFGLIAGIWMLIFGRR
ncbi:MAG: hypothetical protein ACT4O9_01355 [Blastocatellia bacterium]